MKKIVRIVSVFIFLIGSTLVVQAQPLPGVYDSRNSDLEPGSWEEVLINGNDGEPGNIIRASSDVYWFGLPDEEPKLQQVALLSSPTADQPYYLYQTLYNGGLMTLVNGGTAPWENEADDSLEFLATIGIVKVLTKKFVNPDDLSTPTGEIAFKLKATAEFGEYPGYRAHIKAAYQGMPNSTLGNLDAVIMSGDLDWVLIKIVGPKSDLSVAVDIKPGSCPNPLNIKSKGVLPVAILGTEDFDVKDIRKRSIRLAGVKPLRSSYEDVATPFEPFTGKQEAYDCNELGDDGYLDLTLKFKRTAIVRKVKQKYGKIEHDRAIVLELTGKLKDGTPFYGEDVVIIKKPGNSKK